MLNIELQCCALFMLVVLLLIFINEHALDLSSRRLYFYALLSCIVCIVFDIASIVGIAAATEGTISEHAACFICKLYVMSLVIQSFQGFLYAAGEFFTKTSHHRTLVICQGIMVLGLVCVMLLPIHFYMEGRIVYSYGPSVVATYIFSLFFITSTILMVFRHNDRLSRRRRLAILLWEGSWLTAAMIQLFHPDLLLVSFFGAFGIVLVYAELENPHEGIDRASGLFTSNALFDYVDDRYHHQIPFAGISVRYEHPNQATDYETERTILVRMANFFKTFESAHVFRHDENEFILIFNDTSSMEKALADIMSTIYQIINLPLRFRYIAIQDSLIASGADEFFRLHRYLVAPTNDNEIVFADQHAIDHIREYAIVKEMIESAMEDNRVEVFFQPMYNVDKNQFTTAEALVRIRDKNGEIVPPGKFIPVAEENGLIIPLGEEIFRQVCEMLATGEPTRHGIEYIEVNLSVAQFDQSNLAEVFFDIADQYGVDSAVINLEITETASTSAKLVLLNNMKKFLDKGVRFSLDDFGTGRSNLDYFIEMPVDIIKFDYTFTQSYFTNPKAKEVMESVVGMFHRMNMKIVSEGVETKEQFDAMCALGINYIQGFYFSKPIPKSEFLSFLKEKNG